MQIAKRMAAVMAMVSLMTGTGLQAAAVSSSANRLAIGSNVAAPAGARVGAKHGKESKAFLGIPILLAAALGVAAAAVVVTQVADNNHSDSP